MTEQKNRKIIVDTDIGYDPDDLFALHLLSKLIKKEELALLVTANRIQNKREVFASMALHSLGLGGVKIVGGIDIGLDKFTVDELLRSSVHHNSGENFIDTMQKVANSCDEVLYIGIGGFSNIATYIKAHPESEKKFTLFLMGGAINYVRRPDWVEFNARLDPQATKTVIESGWDVHLIMAQTTHNPLYVVDANHSLYKRIQSSTHSSMRLLREHCELWFAQRGHGTSMHDPLTVAVALGYDYVSFNSSKVIVDEKGNILIDENGFPILCTQANSKAEEFMKFLSEKMF